MTVDRGSPDPKTPKSHAQVERCHRTVEESWVDDHEDRLCTDRALFNPKRIDWLVFDNAHAPPSTRTENPGYPSASTHPSAPRGGRLQRLASGWGVRLS